MAYTISDIAAGSKPTAAAFAAISDPLEEVANGTRDAERMSTHPIIAAAAFATETDIPGMKLSFSAVAGRIYWVLGQLVYAMSNTDTEANILVRRDTALTGTQIGSIRLGRPPFAGNGHQVAWCIPFKAPTTTTQDVFFSVLRATGTGNTTLEGPWGFSGVLLSGLDGTIRVV